VSDDWLQNGHEMEGSELTPVFSSSSVLAEGASVPRTPTWTSGWRAVVLGGGLVLLATLGVVGVANAISDSLFPSMGSTSPASVWLNPVPPSEPSPTTVVVSSTSTTIPSNTPTTTSSTVASDETSTIPTTAPSSNVALSSGGSSRPITTAVSPTTSTLDQSADGDRVDDSVDDDSVNDDSGSSSGSVSGPDDSDSSGRSGSDDSGSDDSDDD
jgi:hypothetical protein